MRLMERTMKLIAVAPRQTAADALGALTERFSDQRIPVRANVIPSSSGGLSAQENGLCAAQTMCLLLPRDAVIAVGDGVCVDSEEPGWRCVGLQRWSAHTVAQAERLRPA